MLTIRTNDSIDQKLDYLRLHKVRFAPILKVVIESELSKLCDDFKMKESRIKNAPSWVYD